MNNDISGLIKIHLAMKHNSSGAYTYSKLRLAYHINSDNSKDYYFEGLTDASNTTSVYSQYSINIRDTWSDEQEVIKNYSYQKNIGIIPSGETDTAIGNSEIIITYELGS